MTNSYTVQPDNNNATEIFVITTMDYIFLDDYNNATLNIDKTIKMLKRTNPTNYS